MTKHIAEMVGSEVRFFTRLQTKYYKVQIIIITNKKDITFTYDHDEIYSTFQEKFESMKCFQEYKSYTNSNAVPAFCRELSEIS